MYSIRGGYIVRSNENYWTLIVFMIDEMDMAEITCYLPQSKQEHIFISLSTTVDIN